MNWVGGARSRVKIERDKKKQQEYFERKRLNQSSNASSAFGKPSTGISRDLSLLQMITNVCNTSTSKGNEPRIHEADLGSKNSAIFPLSPSISNICKSEISDEKEDDFLSQSKFFYKPKNKNGNFWKGKSNVSGNLFYSSCSRFSQLGNKLKNGCGKKNTSRVQWASEDFQETPLISKDVDKTSWNETENFPQKEFDNEGPTFKPFQRNKFQGREEFCQSGLKTDEFQSPFISTWLDQQKKQTLDYQPKTSTSRHDSNFEKSSFEMESFDKQKLHPSSFQASQQFEKEEILSSETEEVLSSETEKIPSSKSSSIISVDPDVEDLLLELVCYISIIYPEKTGIDASCQWEPKPTKNISIQTSPMNWCSVCAHDKMFFNCY